MPPDWKTCEPVTYGPNPKDMHGTAADLRKSLRKLRLRLLELARQTHMGRAVDMVDGWNALLVGILA